MWWQKAGALKGTATQTNSQTNSQTNTQDRYEKAGTMAVENGWVGRLLGEGGGPVGEEG